MALYLDGWMPANRIIAHMQDECYHVVQRIVDCELIYFTIVAASSKSAYIVELSDAMNNDGYNTIVFQRKGRTLFWKGDKIESVEAAFVACNKAPKP